MNPSALRAGWDARYFLMNGRSGLFASHHEDVLSSDFVGRPYLIVSAGMNTHSLHLHGNHFYLLPGGMVTHWDIIGDVDAVRF